jgi:hypothetical protein
VMQYPSGIISTAPCGCQMVKNCSTLDCRPVKRLCQSHLVEAMAGKRTESKKEVVMDDVLGKLDSLALEVKLLTTEIREVGPNIFLLRRLKGRLTDTLNLLNTTAAQGD